MIEESLLLQLKPDTKEHIQKLYGLDKPEKVDQAVEILQQWLKKQNHFTKKEYDRKYLESTLYDTKGSIELAKEKLEKRCIFRTVLPHYFEFDDFISEFEGILTNLGCGAPLPKLTDQHYRIISYKINNNDFFKKTPFLVYYKFSFVLFEYLKAKDCCAGYIFVVDFRDVSVLDLVSRIKPHDVKHWATFLTEAQGFRLKKLIYLSSSKTIEAFVNIVKPVLSKKLADRIEVVRDVDDLQKFASKDMLPVEYGGTDRSIMDLQADWMKVLSSKDFMNYYDSMRNAKIDEKIKKIEQEENYVELAGSFVTLNFD